MLIVAGGCRDTFRMPPRMFHLSYLCDKVHLYQMELHTVPAGLEIRQVSFPRRQWSSRDSAVSPATIENRAPQDHSIGPDYRV